MVRWLKKSSKETITCVSIIIWIWDGSKFEPFMFLLEIMITCFFAKLAHFFQNWNHYCLEFNFSSSFEPSQQFRAKKNEPIRQKERDQYFKGKMNGFNFDIKSRSAATESITSIKTDFWVCFAEIDQHLKSQNISKLIALFYPPRSIEWSSDFLTTTWFPDNYLIITTWFNSIYKLTLVGATEQHHI